MGTRQVRSKQEIVSILLSHKNEIETLGVNRIALFGSFMKDMQRKESDVDLLVEFTKGKKNFRNFIRLAFLLEDLFKRKVELVTKESLSPHLKPAILKEMEYVLQ